MIIHHGASLMLRPIGSLEWLLAKLTVSYHTGPLWMSKSESSTNHLSSLFWKDFALQTFESITVDFTSRLLFSIHTVSSDLFTHFDNSHDNRREPIRSAAELCWGRAMQSDRIGKGRQQEWKQPGGRRFLAGPRLTSFVPVCVERRLKLELFW